MRHDMVANGGLTWVELSKPTPEELAAFVREAMLEPTDAEFVVQNHHRPEVAVRHNYLLILVHVPTFNKQTRVTRGVPLYFVVTTKQLWVIHEDPIVPLQQLWEDYELNADKREEYFSMGALGLALQIITVMHNSAFRKLDRLTKHVDIAEDAVFQGNERKMVEEISILRRDVMDFRKIIRLQIDLFSTPPTHPLVTDELRSLWLRLNGQTRRLWDLLESLDESTTQLAETNDSLLQHKENQLLRFLTYYSIFSIPLLFLIDPLGSRVGVEILPTAIYGSGLFLLAVMLVVIFIRFRGKRVL